MVSKSLIAFVVIQLFGNTFAKNYVQFPERKLKDGGVVCEFSGGTFSSFHTLGEDGIHEFTQIAGEVLADASIIKSDKAATLHVFDQVMQPVEVPVRNRRQLWDYFYGFFGFYGTAMECTDCDPDDSDAGGRRLVGVADMLRERLVDQMPFFAELDCARIKCGDFEDVSGEGCYPSETEPLFDPIPQLIGDVASSSNGNGFQLVTAVSLISVAVALCF